MSSIWDGEDTIPGLIWIITSVAALNWGLVEFLDMNLVMELTNAVGGETAAMVIYGIIGVAGLITLLDHLGLYDVTDVVESITGN